MMTNRKLSIAECQKACDDDYNSNTDYVQVYNSIVFWLQKKQGKKQINSKINKSGGQKWRKNS